MLAPLGLLAAACGGATGDETDSSPSAVTSTAPNGDGLNDADVEFARTLLPHHADALLMVDLTLGRELDPAVADLLEALRAEHAAQVQTLSGWLTSWGEQVPETARDHANAHASEDAGSQDDHGDLAAIERAQGEEFEQALLTALVEHHAEGIALAEQEVSGGAFGPARELAADVVSTQEREVEQMRVLLAERDG